MADQTVAPDSRTDSELLLRFMSSALAGLPTKAWETIYGTLTDAQKKDPAFAAAVMSEKVARAAVHVFKSEKKGRKNGDGTGGWSS